MNQSKTFFALLFTLIMALCSCSYFEKQNKKNNIKHYEANWESLEKHKQVPEWLADAKLGIYFHWGAYSVPAYGHEWYPCFMFKKGDDMYQHHMKTYGDPAKFGYDKLIEQFKAEQFDPEDWAGLFKASGARFAGPVAQHHDGFAMWASNVNPWNVKDMGPQRDILGEIFNSLKNRGIKTIATFHHARNGQRNAKITKQWYGNTTSSHYPYDPELPTSSTDPKLSKLYGNFENINDFNDYWLQQVNEVVDNYSPDIIWFDSWLNLIPESHRKEMVAHYLNHAKNKDKEVAIAYKEKDLPFSVGILDFEQGGRREINEMPWMTDVTMGDGRPWSYVEGMKYKTAEMIIRNMIDVWSKNGIVLLNISPKADGIIPDEQRSVLLEIGNWMEKHAEAIYGTKAHSKNGFGTAIAENSNHDGQSATVAYTATDIRFTKSKDDKALYVFFLGKPKAGERITFPQFKPHRHGATVKKVSLLNSDVNILWEQTTKEFSMTVPNAEMNAIATVFKIEM